MTVAGNPVLSTPDSDRLDAALASLDFMVAIDIYLNETTRHADVILPGTTPLRRDHYDFAFYQLSVRNIANYSPPLFDLPEDTPDEWQILLRLGATVSGQGADADIDALDDAMFAMTVGTAVADPGSPIHGRSPEEIYAATGGERGPTRMLDYLLRVGPYGDRYGEDPDGLTLATLEAAPHGIDLGPLQPRLPQDLCTPSGHVELAPPDLLADVTRLSAALDRTGNGTLVLIGRRDVRSNNSWMHNVDVLVKGKERCTLQIHPTDAETARCGHRRAGQGVIFCRDGDRSRRGDRRHHGRRGEPAPWVGPRPGRGGDGGRRRPTRGQQQPSVHRSDGPDLR